MRQRKQRGAGTSTISFACHLWSQLSRYPQRKLSKPAIRLGGPSFISLSRFSRTESSWHIFANSMTGWVKAEQNAIKKAAARNWEFLKLETSCKLFCKASICDDGRLVVYNFGPPDPILTELSFFALLLWTSRPNQHVTDSAKFCLERGMKLTRCF